jgi:enoyl-CoA hydratase
LDAAPTASGNNNWRHLVTSSNDESLVRTTRHGHVLLIEMRRERKRNAFDRALADALDAALNELDDDPDLWAGVLTGTATSFSAGSDLSAGGDYNTPRGGEYGIIRRRRAVPLIAAVEGFALGGGFEIVLSCDLVVAAESATLGLPEVVRGVLPTSGALFRALTRLPANVAKQLVLTGQPLSVERAHEIGLVNEVVPAGTAVERALELAQSIAANAPLSVQASLRALSDLLDADDDAGWAATTRARESISGSEDTAEGVRAFFERRPPVWRGR